MKSFNSFVVVVDRRLGKDEFIVKIDEGSVKEVGIPQLPVCAKSFIYFSYLGKYERSLKCVQGRGSEAVCIREKFLGPVVAGGEFNIQLMNPDSRSLFFSPFFFSLFFLSFHPFDHFWTLHSPIDL